MEGGGVEWAQRIMGVETNPLNTDIQWVWGGCLYSLIHAFGKGKSVRLPSKHPPVNDAFSPYLLWRTALFLNL